MGQPRPRGCTYKRRRLYPIKFDDIVKSAVVQGDGRTIRDDFAGMFCAAKGLIGVKNAFWLSKGDRIAGQWPSTSRVRTKHARLWSGGRSNLRDKFAFVKEFRKLPRPIQVLQLQPVRTLPVLLYSSDDVRSVCTKPSYGLMHSGGEEVPSVCRRPCSH